MQVQLPTQPLALVKDANGRYGLQSQSSPAWNLPSPSLAPAPALAPVAISATPVPVPYGEAGIAVGARQVPVTATVVGTEVHPALSSTAYLPVSAAPATGLSPLPADRWAAHEAAISAFEFGPTARRPHRESMPVANSEKERLRGKLLDLGSTFVEFDKRVEDDARRRREIEEHRLRDTLATLSRLEATLAEETRQREEATRGILVTVERLLENMVSRMQGSVLERFQQLSRSVESLCERCSTVERGIQQFRGEVPSKLGVETVALRKNLRRLVADFQADQHQRREEDAQLLRAFEEGEGAIDTRLQQEVAHLERQREALQELIDEFMSAEDREERQRQRDIVQDRLTALESDLTEEASARELADDQVVQAINEYTSLLHRSLRMSTA